VDKFTNKYWSKKRVEVLDLTRISTINKRLVSSGIHVNTLAAHTGLKVEDLRAWLTIPTAEILTAIEVAIVQLEKKMNQRPIAAHKAELEILLEHPAMSYNRIVFLKQKIKNDEASV
jgi:hypothetical protein